MKKRLLAAVLTICMMTASVGMDVSANHGVQDSGEAHEQQEQPEPDEQNQQQYVTLGEEENAQSEEAASPQAEEDEIVPQPAEAEAMPQAPQEGVQQPSESVSQPKESESTQQPSEGVQPEEAGSAQQPSEGVQSAEEAENVQQPSEDAQPEEAGSVQQPSEGVQQPKDVEAAPQPAEPEVAAPADKSRIAPRAAEPRTIPQAEAPQPEAGTTNFIFVEKENVSLSQQQNILISVGSDGGNVTEAQLVYHKQGSAQELTASQTRIAEDTVLFSLPYTSASQEGAYRLDRMCYTTEQGRRFEADLTKERTVTYGVETQVQAKPDARLVDEDINMNVVTFDENGKQETEVSIEDALNYAGAGEASGVGAMGSAGTFDAARSMGAAKNMVFVLDPGHGGSDPGATRTHNGVTYYERDIVLKITNYCKAELEKYAGVKVYMTRTDNTSPLMDRWQRTQFALQKGANVIISFHINSTGDQETTASGSLVYVPNADTPSAAVSQELARKILEKLQTLGLQNRGLLINESLGMIKYPKDSGVPGILIEHAFVNNAGDVANYLSSDAKLKKLGVADATGIAAYYKLKKKNTKYEDYEAGSGTLKVKANKEQTKYTMSLSGVEKAYSVRFAVWSDASNQADLKWYDATLNSSGVWTTSFKVSSFKKKGNYNIHAYILDAYGDSVFAQSTAVSVKGTSVKKVTIDKVNPAKGTFRIRATGVSSGSPISKVTVKVWSQKNKKDAYTYTAKKQKDGSYLITANIKRHKYNYGTYQVYVYATDKNGITKTVKKSVKLKKNWDLTAKANKSQTKYTITANALPGYKSVKMAVWSDKNGQDDLKWYEAKKNDDGKWSVSVKISKHKSAGTYHIHMYGKDPNKKQKILGTSTFRVTAPAIKELTVKKVNPDAGTFYFYIKGVSAKAGVDTVTVKVYPKNNSKLAYTYTAKETDEGIYRIKVNIKKHNNYEGTYRLKTYVKDQRGIVKTKTYTYTFPSEEDPSDE